MNQNSPFQTNAHPSSMGGQQQPTGGTSMGNQEDIFGGASPSHNIFGAGQQQQQQQQLGNMPQNMPQQPPQDPTNMSPANPQPNSGMHAQPNPDVQGGSQQQQGQQEGASPLDKFTPKEDNGDNGQGQQQQEQQQPASVFDASQDDWRKIAARQDYSNTLSDENFNKILNGDAGALREVLNSVGQQAFVNASFASSRVSRAGLENQFKQFQQDQLPNILRDQSFSNAFEANDHAVLKHPAVAPLVQQQQQVLRNQYPNASPKEIQEKVVEYFQGVAQAFTTNQQQEQRASQPVTGEEQGGAGGLDQLFE